jgi:hypothetical protein
VDIEPNVDFSFHVVCLSVRVSLDESERILAHYGAVLADRPSRAARDLMNDKHTASFQGCTRRSIADPQPYGLGQWNTKQESNRTQSGAYIMKVFVAGSSGAIGQPLIAENP